uniref:Cytosol aminopeptidase domain-containing protein n=1 Tax=Ditylenchus dipsaci TaxID=166011 RepID=A0A915DB41_9BILA
MPNHLSATWNGLIGLAHPLLKHLHQPIHHYSTLHQNLAKGGASLIVHQDLPSKRLIYAATGSVTSDFDDVRNALSAGLKSPLFVVLPSSHFANAQLLGLIGLLHSFYVPLNVREAEPNKAKRVSQIGVLTNLDPKDPNSTQLLQLANAFQSSFSVCRDVGDSDPNTSVKVTVESDPNANDVPAHQARLIWLEYENKETPKSDKDFETLMMPTPTKGIKVVGNMCMVRNSVGSNAYTCDEIITARSGKRVHIYNTDAEGRIAMLGPLTKFREQAVNEKNPHLMTVATLTGIVCSAISTTRPSWTTAG